MGNGEAKELIYTTHGHGLREERWKAEGCRVEGNKGEKKWENCSSIINKIYLKQQNKKQQQKRKKREI